MNSLSRRSAHPSGRAPLVNPNSPQAATVQSVAKELVDRAGGNRAAGRVVGMSKSSIHKYTDTNNPPPKGGRKPSMPVSVALDLERHVGEPILTRFLAQQQGYLVRPISDAALLGDATPTQLNLRFCEQACDVMRDGANCLDAPSRAALIRWRNRLRRMMTVGLALDCALSREIDPPSGQDGGS